MQDKKKTLVFKNDLGRMFTLCHWKCAKKERILYEMKKKSLKVLIMHSLQKMVNVYYKKNI